jgi:hypothetical protein
MHTPIFEWYILSLVVKNEHQKDTVTIQLDHVLI